MKLSLVLGETEFMKIISCVVMAQENTDLRHRTNKNESNLGMIDAGRELFGSKAAKYEAVWGSNPCAGQHGEHGLGHHGHVDDY